MHCNAAKIIRVANPLVARFVAPNPGPLTLDGTNSYVVAEDRAYVIDPGPDISGHRAAVERWIEGQHLPPAAVLLTHQHADHAAGARLLARDLGVPVAEPGAPSDIALPAWLEAIPTSGHTRVHVAFWLPLARILFSGDTVLGRGTAMVTEDGSMAEYLRTLARLQSLDPAMILPGHGPVILTPSAVLQDYVEHRLEREQEIIAALARGPAAVPELVERVYRGLDPTLKEAAGMSVRSHLGKLLEEGRVTEHGGIYRLGSTGEQE